MTLPEKSQARLWVGSSVDESVAAIPSMEYLPAGMFDFDGKLVR